MPSMIEFRELEIDRLVVPVDLIIFDPFFRHRSTPWSAKPSKNSRCQVTMGSTLASLSIATISRQFQPTAFLELEQIDFKSPAMSI